MPLEILAKCSVPLLLTGPHTYLAHTSTDEVACNECECAIDAGTEAPVTEHFARNEWNIVYRTPFFAKFRLLSTGTPVIKVLFLDPTTFGKLRDDSFERVFSGFTLRVPSLIHVVAMKLQTIKIEPDREDDDLPEILSLLRINQGGWKDEELDAVCKRFGPQGIFRRLSQRLAVTG